MKTKKMYVKKLLLDEKDFSQISHELKKIKEKWRKKNEKGEKTSKMAKAKKSEKKKKLEIE